jgi:hypothetical protein
VSAYTVTWCCLDVHSCCHAFKPRFMAGSAEGGGSRHRSGAEQSRAAVLRRVPVGASLAVPYDIHHVCDVNVPATQRKLPTPWFSYLFAHTQRAAAT